MAVIIYIFLRSELFDSRFLVIGAWALGIVFVSVGRLLMRRLQRYLVDRYDPGAHRVLVIGDDEISRRVVSEMRDDRGLGYRVVKQLAHPELAEVRSAIGNPGVDRSNPRQSKLPSERIVGSWSFAMSIIWVCFAQIYVKPHQNFAFDTMSGIPFVELAVRRLMNGGGCLNVDRCHWVACRSDRAFAAVCCHRVCDQMGDRRSGACASGRVSRGRKFFL